MPNKECPQCSKPMKHPARNMSKLDTCDACQLVYLDSFELGFMAGRSTLQADLSRHAKLVDHCARCRSSFDGPTHCGEQQRFDCLECKTQMHEIRLYIPITDEQPELDPYRGSILENAQQNKEAACVYRCPSCASLLLSEKLLGLFTAAFNTKPSKQYERTHVDHFRDALLAIFIEDEKRKAEKER